METRSAAPQLNAAAAPTETSSPVDPGSRRKRHYESTSGTFTRAIKIQPSQEADLNNFFQCYVNADSGESFFRCIKCNKNFGRPYDARRHGERHLKRGERMCEICEELFESPGQLIIHHGDVHGSEQKGDENGNEDITEKKESKHSPALRRGRSKSMQQSDSETMADDATDQEIEELPPITATPDIPKSSSQRGRKVERASSVKVKIEGEEKPKPPKTATEPSVFMTPQSLPHERRSTRIQMKMALEASALDEVKRKRRKITRGSTPIDKIEPPVEDVKIPAAIKAAPETDTAKHRLIRYTAVSVESLASAPSLTVPSPSLAVLSPLPPPTPRPESPQSDIIFEAIIPATSATAANLTRGRSGGWRCSSPSSSCISISSSVLSVPLESPLVQPQPTTPAAMIKRRKQPAVATRKTSAASSGAPARRTHLARPQGRCSSLAAATARPPISSTENAPSMLTAQSDTGGGSFSPAVRMPGEMVCPPVRLNSTQLYHHHPRLGGNLYGSSVHQRQYMIRTASSNCYPAPLSNALVRTILHPAWLRPHLIGPDERRAESERGHSNFILPVRMHRTETMIGRCMRLLEETLMPLPPLLPLLPSPCLALPSAVCDPLTQVLERLPQLTEQQFPLAANPIYTAADGKTTMAWEDARCHREEKTEERKWWEVRTFPSLSGLWSEGERRARALSISSSPPHTNTRTVYAIADQARRTNLLKCTYVTPKQPIFSVHPSQPVVTCSAASLVQDRAGSQVASSSRSHPYHFGGQFVSSGIPTAKAAAPRVASAARAKRATTVMSARGAEVCVGGSRQSGGSGGSCGPSYFPPPSPLHHDYLMQQLQPRGERTAAYTPSRQFSGMDPRIEVEREITVENDGTTFTVL